MRRIPVESDALTSVGYDEAVATVEVEFTTGRVYRYFGVPARRHRALMAAASHGGYFNQHIRPHYRFVELG